MSFAEITLKRLLQSHALALFGGALVACQATPEADAGNTTAAPEAKAALIAGNQPQAGFIAQTATPQKVTCDQDELNDIADPLDRFLEAFECGDELFGTTFNELDGVGARVGGGERFTRVPRADRVGAGEWANHTPARATGPNAQTCEAGCHRQPVGDGSGPADTNVHRDPEHSGLLSHFIQRASPPTFMLGGLQAMAEEISVALNAQRDAARAAARTTPATPTRTINLSVTKGAGAAQTISYGTITVNGTAACPNTTGDCAADITTGLGIAIDRDLIVKPLQWKGAVRAVRDFMTDATHNELGMDSVEITGVNVDGDGDGIANELGFGDITALAAYQGTQPRPTSKIELNNFGLLDPPLTAAQIASINAGATVFNQVGCNACHMPALVLANANRTEPSLNPAYFPANFPTGQNAAAVGVDTANPIRFNLITDLPDNAGLVNLAGNPVPNFGGLEPSPGGGANDAILRGFTDFKRHVMGPGLAEQIDETGTGASTWRTRELWGVGSTAPYLHDHRATTVMSAILEHGGEGAAAANAVQNAINTTQRVNLVNFLENLVLFVGEPPAEVVETPVGTVVATLTINTDWGTGYCATLNVRNAGSTPTTNWSVVLNVGNNTITQFWNSNRTASTGTLTATPAGGAWNQVIAAGATNTSNGFCTSRAANTPPVSTIVSATGTF